MNISFFSVDDYGKIVGKELIKRGYNVVFDTIEDNTDIVFAMCCPSTYALYLYLNKRMEQDNFHYKGKVVSNVLDIPYWRLDDSRFQKYYDRYREMINLSDHVTTISQTTSDQLKSLWNVDSDVLFTVFNNKKLETYMKEKTRYPSTIVCVGRFSPPKNFDSVIRALKGTSWSLKIIGYGGTELTRYRDLINELGIFGEILFNPSDEYVVNELCRATVVVHPSLFEGLSLVPKEALYCNAPVLISDIPVHREYHKDTVTYITPDDINDLRDKIINRKWKSAALGKKELEQYTIEKTTDKVEAWLLKHLK